MSKHRPGMPPDARVPWVEYLVFVVVCLAAVGLLMWVVS